MMRPLAIACLASCAFAKTKWGDSNPNPGWDKYYKGKCDKFMQCAEDGDILCLEKEGIPLCNLEVQQTGIPIPWQKGLAAAAANGQLKTVQLMIKSPLQWWDKDDIVNESFETILMHAAAHGEHKIVHWLLMEGADVRKKSKEEETALDLARASESPKKTVGVMQDFAAMATKRLLKAVRTNTGATPDLVELCLKGGASLAEVDPETQLTALGMAVKNGILETVEKLVQQGAPLQHRHPRTGHDILHMACDSGHYHITSTLLNGGANVNALTTQFNMNCLHLAAMNGRNGIAVLAIKAGVDVNAKDWEGDTALLKYVRQMYGGSAGQDGVVDHLTRSGADLEVRDRDGRTALFFAVDHNQLGAVKALVEAGAKTTAIGQSEQRGQTTKQVGAFEQSVHAGSREVAGWLVANGHREDFKFTNLQGNSQARGAGSLTGLYAVIHQGWESVALDMLKASSEEANQPNADGSTPLFAAAHGGSVQLVEALVKHGASIEHTNRLGETPLFVAVGSGNAATSGALIAAGANVNAVDRRAQTPLFRAAIRGFSPVVLALMQAGASRQHRGSDKGSSVPETAAEAARRHGFAATAELIENFEPPQRAEL
jgi:ankyrin repeat protein